MNRGRELLFQGSYGSAFKSTWVFMFILFFPLESGVVFFGKVTFLYRKYSLIIFFGQIFPFSTIVQSECVLGDSKEDSFLLLLLFNPPPQTIISCFFKFVAF